MEYGDWKDIDGYPNHEVSDQGFVRHKHMQKITNGGPDSKGYRVIRLQNTLHRIHRIVAGAFLDNPDNHPCVDHIDHDKANNRAENLRWCSHAQNQMNKSKQRSIISSQFKGVFWQSNVNKWRAQIRIGGKSKHVGIFDCEVQAAVAYNNAAIQHFREFASLNVIPLDSVT